MNGSPALLVLVAVTACAGDRKAEVVPAEERLPPDPVVSAAPGLEGRYTLALVAGSRLPALMPAPECAVEVLDGDLRLEAGRFVFRSRTRQICIGGAREPVLHAAGGTYSLPGDSLVLTTDVGEAFTEARGAASADAVTLRQLATRAGLEVVTWRFERDSPRTAAPVAPGN